MKALLSLVLATTACAQHPPNPPTYVRCQSPENCLQLNIPDGFNSPFWKSMGYKYNLTTHPECAYVACDLNLYPQIGSIVHDVSGFKGVDLVKYQRPGAVLSATETTEATAAVPTITLNNGVEMPTIAAGTWQYSSQTAHDAVAAALDVGFRHIDTAHDYCGDGTTAGFMSKGCPNGESNQVGIASAIQASSLSRADLFVTTKVPGCGAQGISRDNCAADSVAAAEKNLQELGLNYTDLLLIHFPPIGGCGALNCGVIKKQWAALSAQILGANKTRALGVSNFCVSCIKCLLGDSNDEDAAVVVPAVNQVAYHVGMGADPGGLFSFSKAHGIVVEAYSPLGDNTTELISGPLTSGIGAAHGKSSVQVALRYIVQHGHALTTKSSNPKHLADDIDIFAWALDEKTDMANLDASTKPPGKPSFMCTA